MSEPTKAAMRAAIELQGGTRLQDFTTSRDVRRDAEIIDRETGLPELVAAVHNAIDDITALINTFKAETDTPLESWLDGYRAALRKAGEL